MSESPNVHSESYENFSVERVSGSCSPSRRSFLTGIAALGAASLLPGELHAAQSGGNPRRIDMHHHFKPQVWTDYLKAHNLSTNGTWTLEADLEDMDKAGVATSILSITTPLYEGSTIEEGRKISRLCNDAAAKIRADHPGRFGIFAVIPLHDTEGALHEIEYAFDTLKVDGVALFTEYEAAKWLGHPSFAPVYEELNRRKAIAYVHPGLSPCCVNLPAQLPNIPSEGAGIEFGTDTTRAIADLIFSGTTTRFPDMIWVFSHAGGTLPFTIERFIRGTSAEIVPGVVTKGATDAPPKNVPKGVLYELRKLYYDTAQASNPIAMGALRKLVPTSQIVFGTDYWFRTAVETAQNLDGCKVFNAAEMRAINRGNAERILPKHSA